MSIGLIEDDDDVGHGWLAWLDYTTSKVVYYVFWIQQLFDEAYGRRRLLVRAYARTA